MTRKIARTLFFITVLPLACFSDHNFLPLDHVPFSWETGIELPTLMDLEKMVDERGIEPPTSSLRTGNH